jgi:acyl carrier protein
MTNTASDIVNCAIDRVNELLPFGEALPKDPNTVLLGRDGKLDSMGFVNLMVALEEILEERLGCRITLAEEVMLDENGIQTVGDLEKIINNLIIQRSPTGA